VLFSTAVQHLVEDGHDIFLEISPHPILLSAMQQGFHHFGQEGAVLPSLRREEDEHTVLLGSLGALYTLGYPVDWNLIYRPAAGAFDSHSTRGNGSVVGLSPQQRHRLSPEQVSRSGTGNHPLLGRHFKPAHPAGTTSGKPR